ncbi:hypothetical protein [Hymenobacter rigui]|uniref:Uncharacterized protein n=1 Tax=Hymenobacter rigui TaxID=334424 RepID=A0A3R9NJY2_9BACT|nr:hypothetical protein [Hymenobacter rigui]RSK48804.1 hypothetical protein EI291_09565 [Hymenobacter rigui]
MSTLRLVALSGFLVLQSAAGYGQARAVPKGQAKVKDTTEAEVPLICYFPPNCFKPANPGQLPLSITHARLVGKVFVKFTVDSTLTFRGMTVACARLKWKRTGKPYAPDCQHLTATQRRELSKLTFSLVRQLKMVPDPAASRSQCPSEMWTVPVTVR